MSQIHSQHLPVGLQAPTFQLPDPRGKSWQLTDFSSFPGVLVVFMSNHCPNAQLTWPILTRLHQKFGRNVAFVAINANNEEAYPTDNLIGMRQVIELHQVLFPYLRDSNQEVAEQFQASCTPEPFLLRNEGEGYFSLFYHGRVNDNWQYPDHATQQDLEMALDKLVSDQDPPAIQKPALGCSIFWN